MRAKCYTRSGWIASSLYAGLRLDLRLNIAAHNEIPEINYLRLKEFEYGNIRETGGSEPCFQGCVLKPLQRTGLFPSKGIKHQSMDKIQMGLRVLKKPVASITLPRPSQKGNLANVVDLRLVKQ